MDIKAPKNKYTKVAGVPVNHKNINKSIELIQKSAPDYEFRTTFVPGLLKNEDIVEIAHWLEGSKRFILQQFKSDVPLISSQLDNIPPYSKEAVKNIVNKIQPFFEICTSRGN
jgi:pyruvate formate lyase activating enzyme